MRILIITPFYAPDRGASAPLYEMLCEDLVRIGHDVAVIAAVRITPRARSRGNFKKV